jgi:hypothetical protein
VNVAERRVLGSLCAALLLLVELGKARWTRSVSAQTHQILAGPPPSVLDIFLLLLGLLGVDICQVSLCEILERGAGRGLGVSGLVATGWQGGQGVGMSCRHYLGMQDTKHTLTVSGSRSSGGTLFHWWKLVASLIKMATTRSSHCPCQLASLAKRMRGKMLGQSRVGRKASHAHPTSVSGCPPNGTATRGKSLSPPTGRRWIPVTPFLTIAASHMPHTVPALFG